MLIALEYAYSRSLNERNAIMSLIKQSLPEDFSVLTGQELEPDYPSEQDYLVSELHTVALKISKLNNITGYEEDVERVIELLKLTVDVQKLKVNIYSQKAVF